MNVLIIARAAAGMAICTGVASIGCIHHIRRLLAHEYTPLFLPVKATARLGDQAARGDQGPVRNGICLRMFFEPGSAGGPTPACVGQYFPQTIPQGVEHLAIGIERADLSGEPLALWYIDRSHHLLHIRNLGWHQ